MTRHALYEEELLSNVNLPENWTLYKHQIDGASRALHTGKIEQFFFFCADRMGIGKTITLLLTITVSKLPTLIVVPLVVLGLWEKMAKQLLQGRPSNVRRCTYSAQGTLLLSDGPLVRIPA